MSGRTPPSMRGRNPAAQPSRSSPDLPRAERHSSSNRRSRRRRTCAARRWPTRLWAVTTTCCLRSWLKDNGLQTNKQGGGDVFIKPTKPESAIVQEFSGNQIAGAVESAPYDVQMVKAGGVRLWPDLGTITILVVRQDFLAAHPEAVAGLLRGQIEADQLIHDDPSAAKQAANNALAKRCRQGPGPGCTEPRRSRKPPSPTTPMPRRSPTWRASRFRLGCSSRST